MVEGMPKLISRSSLRNFPGLAAGWEHPLAEAPAKGLGRMVFSVPPYFAEISWRTNLQGDPPRKMDFRYHSPR